MVRRFGTKYGVAEALAAQKLILCLGSRHDDREKTVLPPSEDRLTEAPHAACHRLHPRRSVRRFCYVAKTVSAASRCDPSVPRQATQTLRASLKHCV